MWKNLVGTLQHGIDEAADFLQDGDSESLDGSTSTDQVDANPVDPMEKDAPVDTLDDPHDSHDEKSKVTRADDASQRSPERDLPSNSQPEILEPLRVENECSKDSLLRSDGSEPGPMMQLSVTSAPDTKKRGSTPTFEGCNEDKEGLSQLLRFQQQLAEEMNNNSRLLVTNKALEDQLKSIASERDNLTKQLCQMKSEGDVTVLIEKLGREKLRSKQFAQERNELGDEVATLQQKIEQLMSSGDSSKFEQEELRQSRDAAVRRIDLLEKQLQTHENINSSLEEKVCAATQEKAEVLRELKELQSTCSDKILEVKTSSNDSLEYYQREVDRLSTALKRSTADFERRTIEMERHLSLANTRAHDAELRLSDLELGSVQSLQDLRKELDDSQNHISTLSLDLNSCRTEALDLRSQMKSLVEDHHIEIQKLSRTIATQSATIEALAEEKERHERQRSDLQSQLESALTERDMYHKQVMQLRSSSAMSPPTVDSPFNALSGPVASSLSDVVAPPLEEAHSAARISRPAFVMPAPHFAADRIGGSLSHADKSRSRLEKELLKQSMEIDRLKQKEQTHTLLQTSMKDLTYRYELLLQMYGKLVEESSVHKKHEAAAIAAPSPNLTEVKSIVPVDDVPPNPSGPNPMGQEVPAV